MANSFSQLSVQYAPVFIVSADGTISQYPFCGLFPRAVFRAPRTPYTSGHDTTLGDATPGVDQYWHIHYTTATYVGK